MALRPLSCITNAAASITWLVTNPQVDRYQIFGFCSCFVLSVASVALGFKPVGVAILAPCFFSSPCPKHGTSLVLTYHCGLSLFHFWRSGKNTKWSTKWNTNVYLGIQNEAGQRLTVLQREYTGHSKHPLQQHKRQLYIWTSPDGQYQNHIDSILCSQRWRSSIWSAKTRPGADYGSDHEFLIAKFRHKLKKVRKTTRPFRYDLNQIPYDYIVEVTNRFKGLDLIGRVLEELCMEVCNFTQ